MCVHVSQTWIFRRVSWMKRNRTRQVNFIVVNQICLETRRTDANICVRVWCGDTKERSDQSQSNIYENVFRCGLMAMPTVVEGVELRTSNLVFVHLENIAINTCDALLAIGRTNAVISFILFLNGANTRRVWRRKTMKSTSCFIRKRRDANDCRTRTTSEARAWVACKYLQFCIWRRPDESKIRNMIFAPLREHTCTCVRALIQ